MTPEEEASATAIFLGYIVGLQETPIEDTIDIIHRTLGETDTTKEEVQRVLTHILATHKKSHKQ